MIKINLNKRNASHCNFTNLSWT